MIEMVKSDEVGAYLTSRIGKPVLVESHESGVKFFGIGVSRNGKYFVDLSSKTEKREFGPVNYQDTVYKNKI